MYKKGRRAERSIVEKLWNLDYAAIRVPGSGRSYRRPHPDIVAGNGKRYLSFQVKSTKENQKYLAREEVSDLEQFSSIFGSEPFIVIKFGKTVKVYSPEDLTSTEKGYKADISQGKTLEELLNVDTSS